MTTDRMNRIQTLVSKEFEKMTNFNFNLWIF